MKGRDSPENVVVSDVVDAECVLRLLEQYDHRSPLLNVPVRQLPLGHRPKYHILES